MVHKEGNPALEVILNGFNLKTLLAARGYVMLNGNGGSTIHRLAQRANDGGTMQVVHQRGHPVEAHRAEQLLVVKVPVRFAELGVSFGRDLSQAMVNRHKRWT